MERVCVFKPGSANSQSSDALAVHRALRHEIHSHRRLVDSLLQAFNQGARFYPNVGNLGDGLIQLGTFDLFRGLGTPFPHLVGMRHDALDDCNFIVLSGGGGWLEGTHDFWVWLLRPFLERGGRLLVLPSSFLGHKGFFSRHADQIEVFCREQVSFEHMRSITGMEGRVHLCHDLAFAIDPRRLRRARQGKGSGELFLLRTDLESTGRVLPAGNIDLSLVENGVQWTSESRCDSLVGAAAQLMSSFATVTTDRLHMSILAALVGRRVKMRANSYHKNAGVFEMSISRFPDATFDLADIEP